MTLLRFVVTKGWWKINMNKKTGIIITAVVALIIVTLGLSYLVIYNTILAPRTKIIKVKAQKAGVRTNMLMLEGITYNVIDNYTSSEEGIESLETKIRDDINAIASQNRKMTNPITRKNDCIEKSNISSGGAILYISKNDNNQENANSSKYWPDKLNGAEGMVGYAAYIDSETNKLSIKITAYDANGNRMADLEKIIHQ